MLFVSSGTLSYYSQLLHYDSYPDLVYPIEMVIKISNLKNLKKGKYCQMDIYSLSFD